MAPQDQSTHSSASPAPADKITDTAKTSSKARGATPHHTPLVMRPLFWVILVVAICIGALVAFALLHSGSQPQTPTTQSDSSSANSDTTELGQDSSPETPSADPDSDPTPTTPTEPDRVTQYEGGDPNQLAELTGSIAAKYIDPEQNLIIITATIDQYLAAPGTCTLVITRGAYTFFTGTATAAADVTTSGCGPFEIPLSSLPSSTYELHLTISAAGKTGFITDELSI